jgi:hypothetical protein
MIRSMCKAITVATGLAVIASVAMAGVPDPTKSSTDGNFMLGNARGGFVLGPSSTPSVPNIPPAVVDGYNVTVRDVANIPLAGVTVSFNYPSGTLRTMSTQQFGQTANCSSNTTSAVTNGSGQAVIVPAVVGRNESPSGSPTVQVRANGVLLTTITLRSYDLQCEATGPGKVTGFDFNVFRQHFLVGQPFFNQPACDYTNDGAVNGFDFNGFRTEFLCNTSTGLPTGTVCSQTQCSPCP